MIRRVVSAAAKEIVNGVQHGITVQRKQRFPKKSRAPTTDNKQLYTIIQIRSLHIIIYDGMVYPTCSAFTGFST